MCIRVLSILAVLGLLAAPAVGQISRDTTAVDSLRTYRITEIVTLGESGAEADVGTLRGLTFADLQRLDAPTAAEVVRQLPSAHVTTNSRGESLVYVRGTDSRNTPLYLDGALLTPPWDRRLDLRQLPASLLGGVRVRTGTETVLYGGRGYGGVVEVLSRSRRQDGRVLEIDLAGGNAAALRGSGGLAVKHGPWQADAALTYDRQDGDPLPSGAGVPFSQPDSDLRINTDYRLQSGLVRVGRTVGTTSQVGVTLLRLDAEKGIAPESHLDPALDRVRYWRYPSWRYDLALVNAATQMGSSTWRGAFWVGRQSQTIDQYASSAFSEVTDQEDASDESLGGRLVGALPIGSGSVRVSASGWLARHNVTEINRPGTKDTESEERRYRHAEWSLGATWSQSATERWQLEAGLGVDVFEPFETGPQPDRPGETALSGRLALLALVQDGVTARVGLLADSRFPTMRELFDGALGRFVVNPDLTSEQAFQAEAAARVEGARGWVDLLGFARRVEGTIQQELLPDGQRRRVNLGGSTAYGLELVGAGRLMRRLTVDGYVTLLHARAFTDDVSDRYLDETPAVLGRMQLSYGKGRGIGGLLATRYTGVAFSPGDEAPIRLSPSVLADVRLHYRWVSARAITEGFIRADNLFDAVSLPQAGLPGPGRSVRLGVKLTLDG